MTAIHFNLLNRRNTPDIYSLSKSDDGQSLKLHIKNPTDDVLEIKPIIGKATSEYYHFVLSFQAGFLDSSHRELRLEDAPDWTMAQPQRAANQQDLFYFAYHGDTPISVSGSEILKLTLSGIHVKAGMITQHIRSMLQFNDHDKRFFDTKPPSMPLQFLLTVREDSPYSLENIGQASKDFEAAIGKINVGEDAMDFFFQIPDDKDKKGPSPEDPLKSFKEESINQKISTIVEKAASKTWVKGKVLPPIEKSVEDLEGEMKALRNKTIQPVIAQLKSGWNFLSPDKTGVDLEIEILPNVDFFSLSNSAQHVEIRALPGASLDIYSAKYTISIKTGTLGSSWIIKNNYNSLGMAKIELAEGENASIATGVTLELELNIIPKENPDFYIDNLVLIFNNFAFVKTYKETQNNVEETRQKAEPIAGFEIHLPLYSGPISVHEDGLNIHPQTEMEDSNVSKLLKFGTYGNYQIFHHGSGTFERNTLGIHVNNDDAFGIYSEHLTPLLAVKGETGDLFVKGRTFIGKWDKDHNPGGQLVLWKDKSSDVGPIITLHNPAGGQGAGGAIDFNGTGDLGAGNVPTLRLRSLNDGSYSSHFIIQTKYLAGSAHRIQERFRIQSDGKIGIGTSTPSHQLTIQQTFSSELNKPKVLLQLEAQTAGVDFNEVGDGFGSAIKFAANRGYNEGLQSGGTIENILYQRAEKPWHHIDYWAFNFKLRHNDDPESDDEKIKNRTQMAIYSNGNVTVENKLTANSIRIGDTGIPEEITEEITPPTYPLTVQKIYSSNLDKAKVLLQLEAQTAGEDYRKVKVGFGTAIRFTANRGVNKNLQSGGIIENILHKRGGENGETKEGDYWAFKFKLRDDNISPEELKDDDKSKEDKRPQMVIYSDGNVEVKNQLAASSIKIGNTVLTEDLLNSLINRWS